MHRTGDEERALPLTAGGCCRTEHRGRQAAPDGSNGRLVGNVGSEGSQQVHERGCNSAGRQDAATSQGGACSPAATGSPVMAPRLSLSGLPVAPCSRPAAIPYRVWFHATSRIAPSKTPPSFYEGCAMQPSGSVLITRVRNDTQEAWQMLQFSWLAHREGWPLLYASRLCG